MNLLLSEIILKHSKTIKQNTIIIDIDFTVNQFSNRKKAFKKPYFNKEFVFIKIPNKSENVNITKKNCFFQNLPQYLQITNKQKYLAFLKLVRFFYNKELQSVVNYS